MINGKRVIAITLARGGSKSIPLKNLAYLGGKPLIQHTFDAAKACSDIIDAYYVSTDSDDILRYCETQGVSVIRRPAEFASDTAKSSDAILHALSCIDEKPFYVVELMCTNPFKTADHIRGCLLKLAATAADCVVSVKRLFDHHPSRLKYIEDDLLKDFYPEPREARRQDLKPDAYVRNGAIYAFTYNHILTSKSRYGGVTRPYLMEAPVDINIDEREDLLVAEQFFVKGLENKV